ncbi:MAG TPA: hypothetical protein VKD22_01955 [Ramlibacter sp.]|nr:hypothetical protein [Ramlibacter sp.]
MSNLVISGVDGVNVHADSIDVPAGARVRRDDDGVIYVEPTPRPASHARHIRLIGQKGPIVRDGMSVSGGALTAGSIGGVSVFRFGGAGATSMTMTTQDGLEADVEGSFADLTATRTGIIIDGREHSSDSLWALSQQGSRPVTAAMLRGAVAEIAAAPAKFQLEGSGKLSAIEVVGSRGARIVVAAMAGTARLTAVEACVVLRDGSFVSLEVTAAGAEVKMLGVTAQRMELTCADRGRISGGCAKEFAWLRAGGTGRIVTVADEGARIKRTEARRATIQVTRSQK